ncbi:hypothetical protein FSP39_015911 [Pinctada imbricata]|uniref:Inositol 2-dehydrogenase n=1 Tax=Pinctada imbricata TaxID=66713 RepID=A0AA88YX54_PINIB|nr:hypothetical protein FSP39_015911 [Pinctada imbricata]
MENKVNVAIIGVGRIGQVHLRHLATEERVDIKYLVDIAQTHDDIRRLVNKYRLKDVQILVPEEVHSVINDKTISAVFICTHVDAKADIIMKCLVSGKHVFCEKPMSLKPTTVEECYDMAKKTSTILQCGFDKRFDVSVRSMYDQIKRGDIGKLRMIKLTAREMPALVTSKDYILSSGGLFIDSKVHEFDLLCWFAGESPCEIFAFGHAQNPIFSECGDIDSASVILKFSSGLMGFVESFRGVNYGYDQRTDGLLVVENPRTTLTEKWDDRGQTRDTVWQEGISRYHDAYRNEVAHFIDAVQGRCQCSVSGEVVLLAHKLAVCAKESYVTGKAVTVTPS